MWIDPKNKPIDSKRIDWNEKFKAELKGELEEDQARQTFGKFLEFNIQFTTRILTGMIIKPFQAIIIKGWFEKVLV